MWIVEEAPSFYSEPAFVGFSDNQSLWAVKAWNYWKEHYVEPIIYDSSQVDEQPQFVNLENGEDFEKTIKSEMRKLTRWNSLMDSLSGFVRFTFVIEASSIYLMLLLIALI